MVWSDTFYLRRREGYELAKPTFWKLEKTRRSDGVVCDTDIFNEM